MENSDFVNIDNTKCVEYKYKDGLLSVKIDNCLVELLFTTDYSEFKKNMNIHDIETCDRIFKYDLNIFMDMVGDRPKVVINKNKVQLLYNIIISKNNIEICIELNEIQYEGDDLIVSLQKENNKIKSSLSKLEKELFIIKHIC